MSVERTRPSQDDELALVQRLVKDGADRLAVSASEMDDLWVGIAAEIADEGGHVDGADDPPTGDVVSLGSRRRSLPLAALGAAAALVVGLAGGVVLQSRLAAPVTTELAATQLVPLVDGLEPSTATLQEVDGTRIVQIDLSGLPTPAGFYEVWLLDEAVTQLVSLGPARPDGSYVVPDGVDVVGVPSVDVSLEQPDGDPSHSGDSLLRGTFTL